jgi:Asp/Glu/hydantoin racemase
VLVTFPPTVASTCVLITEAAIAAGRAVCVETELREDALKALLQGDASGHDQLLAEGARALVEAGVEAIVLAQVSMAHMRERLEREFGVPVFSSLETSHRALREALGR